MNAPAPITMTSADLAEIAQALNLTWQAIQKRANKAAWPYTEAPVRGGTKRYYPLASLPVEVRQAVQLARLHQHTESLPIPVTPAQPVTPTPKTSVALLASADAGDLTKHQREVDLAQKRILRFVEEFDGSAQRAIDQLNAWRLADQLPAPLVWALAHAWDKKRKDSALNLSTLNKWKKVGKVRGSNAPKKPQKDTSIKPWHALAVALRQRPQGSTLTWLAQEIADQWNPAWGNEPPSYHVIRRFFDEKFSRIDQLKGRYTGSALRQHKHWKPRTSAGMYPFQEVHADGWNTHFTAPHPITGEFVTYEVWHFHDVATRFVPPPGIGLTETYEVVTAGLERAVRAGGVMAILQTDSTKVIKRSPRFTQDPWAALSERAGITVVHPVEVGNSQANGICENFNTSWLDKKSRELATYQGKGMDSLSLKRVKKLTENMVKASNAGNLVERDRLKAEAERAGKGRVFMSYGEAEAWINAIIDEYNDRPHRSLPKVACPSTGKRRHQTPREALQQHIDDGWKPVALDDAHLVDLFRPHVVCKVTREAVSPIGKGQRYYHPMLGEWNGMEVMVAIDPMDWRTVIIKTLEGEVLGTADLVQASGYRAMSQYEIAEEKRAQAQLKRLGKKAQAVRARTTVALAAPSAPHAVIGGRVVDPAALSSIPAAKEVAQPRGIGQSMGETGDLARKVAHSPAPPVSRSDRSAADNYADWCEIDRRVLAGEPVSEADARWHQRYQTSAQWRAETKRKAAA